MNRFKISFLYFLPLVLLCSSCSAEDDMESSIIHQPEGMQQEVFPDEYHILVLGDSFSRDAFSYVPCIIEEIFPNVFVDMEILYLGGKGLMYHWNYISNQKPLFVLDSYLTSNGKWKTQDGYLGDEVISSKDWDLVILQEGSITVRNYETTKANVQHITNYIRGVRPEQLFAFMLSPAKPDGSPALGDYTSDEVWEINATTARLLLENNFVDYVIPCGTSIQNARKTDLDVYGDFGHLSYDGNHLQEGIPCLLEAYVSAQCLCDILENCATIDDSELHITQKWVKSKNIPGQHGAAIEGNDEDYALSKRCALDAINSPFTISK